MESAARAVQLRPRRRVHRERLAARGGPHRRFRPDLRPLVQLPEQRRKREPDGLAGLRPTDCLHGRSRERLFERSIPAVQHRCGDRTDLRQPWPGVGTQHHAGMPQQDRRPVVVAGHSYPRQPGSGIPPRSVQRVQHRCDLESPGGDSVRQPDEPDHPQLADAGEWLDRPGAVDAEDCGLRCGDRRV